MLRPEELLALDEETIDASNNGHRSFSKKLILGLLLLAILGGGGAGAYFLFFKEPPQSPPQPLPPLTEAPPLTPPASLLLLESSRTIEAPSLDEARIDLQELLTTPQPGRTPSLLTVQLKNDIEERILSMREILDLFGVAVPSAVFAALDLNNTAILLSYETNGSARITFAFAIQNNDSIAQEMTAWEATLPADMESLLQSLGKTSNPENLAFRNGTQEGGTRRFLNYPDPNLSIDYVIHQDKNALLLGTSQASVDAALAALPQN